MNITERTFISDSIRYVGSDDPSLDLFESQYPLDKGISYNSYVILDEKTAVLDTVDIRGSEDFFENLGIALDGRGLDYLIIQHMEPDHSANIERLCTLYPDMKLVGTAKTGQMLSQFFRMDLSGRFQAVSEGGELELGSHTLCFYTAPMVHWPEVMVSYEKSEKVLFSADAFGTFGALSAGEDWLKDASHYYFNIVGKYGANVQALLKKAAKLDIAVIAPLHGPVLKDEIPMCVSKYDTWSSYKSDRKGIFLPYASIHGNTKRAVLEFADQLRSMGEDVLDMDLTREDVSEAVEQAFLYDRTIFAACSYDADLFPPMNDLLHHLKLKNFQNRKVGIIENGSWAPTAAKKMREYLEGMKNITIVDPVVTIRSTRKASDEEAFRALAGAIINP